MKALLRIAWRALRQRPGQPLLATLAVALGVAVVVGVDAANQTALRSFADTAQSLSGSATHRIVGGPDGVDEALYPRLRRELGLRAAAPALEGHARLLDAAGQRGRALRVVGIAPFAEGPLRPWLAFDAGPGDDSFAIGPLLTIPGGVLTSAATADRLGLDVDQPFGVDIAGRRHQLRLVGRLRPTDELAGRGLDDVLLCDLATAQELLGRLGRLDRIDLRLDDVEEGDLRGWLEQNGAGTRLESRRDARGALDDLTAAFRLNLRALSLLALLVGAFLVHNAMQLAVVRRRELFGLLRAVGASRPQILLMVLAEAGVLGGVGALLGLPLGLGLAQGLLGLVGATMQDLYTAGPLPESAQLEPTAAGVVLLLGIAMSLLAALAPAIEATTVAPRVAMSRAGLEQRARRLAWLSLPFGLGLAGVGTWAGQELPGGVTVAFLAVFTVLIGAALATPGLTALLLRLARAPLGLLFGTAGRQAARAAAAGLSRTSVATAALTLAIAATVGLGVMVQSFRSSVADWLGTTLIADAYVTVPSSMSTRTSTRLDPASLQALLDVPAVRDWSTYRRVEVPLAGNPGSQVELAAIRPAAASLDAYRWLDGDRAAAAQALAGTDAVLCSEPLASRLGLGAGDQLTLQTASGPQPFTVAAVFRDYAAERGYAILARQTYDRHWQDDAVASVALWGPADLPADDFVAALRAATEPLDQTVLVRSTGDLRDASLEVFDRTFAVTTALRLLCTLVAFLGVLGALMALQLERARETAVLRAVGATPAQIGVVTLLQNGLLGLCAGLLAIPSGIVLGWLLVEVVHTRSFGWSLMNFEVPPGVLVSAVLLAVLAALLGSLGPVWRAARRTDIATALREE